MGRREQGAENLGKLANLGAIPDQQVLGLSHDDGFRYLVIIALLWSVLGTWCI